MSKRELYPFTAIIGQDSMKEGLILNAINPNIGGILIFGQKGTAKSTAVRALSKILPEIEVVKGCRFGCDPKNEDMMCEECADKIKRGKILESEFRPMKVVDLPIGITEDRLVGTLDIEEAIKNGKKKFEAGILANANRGILYIDEINLLDDHIVDLLLDSAAMGVNTIEREGISYSHPAKFILVATMNPEEGEVRPQLLDRFGLSVEVKGISDIKQRIEIVKLRGEFENDPKAFQKKFNNKEKELKDKIEKTREKLKEVSISDDLLLVNAMLGSKFNIDGHRGDITLMKAAMTRAALHGRNEVLKEDIESIAPMVLFHRMRKLPFEKMKALDNKLIKEAIYSFEEKI